MSDKINGGQTEDKNFVVLAQSSDDGVTHHCGNPILWAAVRLRHREDLSTNDGSGEVKEIQVPYCPKCEYEPVLGIFLSDDRCVITGWIK